MPNSTDLPEEEQIKNLNLKNPMLAGVLTWVLPGLGHYYQGRISKAILFFVCIVPMFAAGCFLGTNAAAGTARNVYYSWRTPDKRFWFLPQSCLGMAAAPACFQAVVIPLGSSPFGRFMAPPQIDPNDRTGMAPTLDRIQQELPFFELGTYLTVIAGLMNLLVIFDAVKGPLLAPPKKGKSPAK